MTDKPGRKPGKHGHYIKDPSQRHKPLSLSLQGWLLDLLGVDNSERAKQAKKVLISWAEKKKKSNDDGVSYEEAHGLKKEDIPW